MIFTETRERELADMRTLNKERIAEFGIYPLCESCIRSCKVAKARGLIGFWCAYHEEG